MSAPRLTTPAGTYEGVWAPAGGASTAPLASFRGVRYAAAPIGPRRWRPPAPPQPFGGVRPAVEPGPACPQPPGWDAPYRAAAELAGVDPRVVEMKVGPTGEDCLHLDLWTPSLDREARLPVMVWIHGGASAFGTGSCPMFDGRRLAAEHGVVVASITHRLGVLGFLAHPDLSRESPDKTSGNYGFLDYVAALEWVRDNAPGLGGDPDNVTIFGESAGGRAVFELLVHRGARGLFHRAIAQSPWDENHHHRRIDRRVDRPQGPLESAHALGDRLAAELGLGGNGVVEALRRLPAGEILAAADRLGFAGSLWGPIVDGVVFADHPLTLIARGESVAVPLIVGWNSNEGTIFFLGDLPFPTAAAYRRWVETSHPETAPELLALYPPSDEPLALHRSFSDLYGDRTFVFPGLLAARALARRTDVWLYNFTHVHPPFASSELDATGRAVGAFHASEIPLIFGTPVDELDPVDARLGDAMRAYWTSFAAAGAPRGEGLPAWPRFGAGDERYLELGDSVAERSGPATDRQAIWLRTLGPRLGLS